MSFTRPICCMRNLANTALVVIYVSIVLDATGPAIGTERSIKMYFMCLVTNNMCGWFDMCTCCGHYLVQNSVTITAIVFMLQFLIAYQSAPPSHSPIAPTKKPPSSISSSREHPPRPVLTFSQIPFQLRQFEPPVLLFFSTRNKN